MRLIVLRVGFVLAHALFLWMYFSAEPLEIMARSGAFAGAFSVSIVDTADRFAAAWRHGMAGNAWLYLPGFFLSAAFTWMWALGRRLPALGMEGLALLVVSMTVAAPLASVGTDLALASFQTATATRAVTAAPGFTLHGAALALFTIVTWDTGVLCCQLSIARRSFRPMLIPVVLNLVLANVRPWTVADFTTDWVLGVARGAPTAVLSACAVPLLAVFLVRCQLRIERRDPGGRARSKRFLALRREGRPPGLPHPR